MNFLSSFQRDVRLDLKGFNPAKAFMFGRVREGERDIKAPGSDRSENLLFSCGEPGHREANHGPYTIEVFRSRSCSWEPTPGAHRKSWSIPR